MRAPSARETWALVTGASNGIGLEIAKLFAADGYNLVLVARSEAKLEALARELEATGVGAKVCAVDLSSPEGPSAVHAFVEDAGLSVSHLVNNAGFGSCGEFWTLDRARELSMIDLNIRALAELCHLFLPAMIERDFGRVLNIGSTAGFQAGPRMATYYATKAFVLHFSEALAHELRSTGVRVTVHCPGATATGFSSAAGNDKSKLFKSGVAGAVSVATDAYAAMHKGRVLKVHGLLNTLMTLSVRASPRAWTRAIAGRLNS